MLRSCQTLIKQTNKQNQQPKQNHYKNNESRSKAQKEDGENHIILSNPQYFQRRSCVGFGGFFVGTTWVRWVFLEVAQIVI